MRNLRNGGWRPKGPKRSIPLPEAIDGERWKIAPREARQAGICLDPKVMVVPFGQEKVERMVRLHEMTHVKITPDEIRGWAKELPESLLQTVEDGRVHGQMARLGFPVSSDMVDLIPDEEMRPMAAEAHPAILAGLAAAMAGTGEYARLEGHLGDLASDAFQKYRDANTAADKEAMKETAKACLAAKGRTEVAQVGRQWAIDRMHEPGTLPDFDTTLQMVRDIVDAFGDPDEPDPPKPLVPVQMASLMMEMKPGALAPPGPELKLVPPPPIPHGTKWGTVRFEEPPLPVKLPEQMRCKVKKIPEVRGRRLHRVGRLATDGRVFAERIKKKGGGAVLIDTSGSMDLKPEEVLQLCAAYPGGIIAAYSSEGSAGTLRVIAKNGKRVPDNQIDPPGGGNGIDGPALDWLAKQPGPRWWISDAGVECGAEGLRYCLQVCLRNQITRVDNAWEIIGRVTT